MLLMRNSNGSVAVQLVLVSFQTGTSSVVVSTILSIPKIYMVEKVKRNLEIDFEAVILKYQAHTLINIVRKYVDSNC